MGTLSRSANRSRSVRNRRLNVREANARASPSDRPRGPGLTPQQRSRLAECCAFFKAEKYREAEPRKIRASDVKEAEAEIEAAIEQCHGRAGST